MRLYLGNVETETCILFYQLTSEQAAGSLVLTPVI